MIPRTFHNLIHFLSVHSSFTIILKRKRKLVPLLLMSYRCIVTINVLWLFLTVSWVGLQYVIVVFPDHTHARIQELLSGGPGPTAKKTAWTTFIFFIYFLVLNLFDSFQRGSNGFITEKTIIYQGPNIFQGVQLFPEGEGGQMLISVEGVWTPYSSLAPHMILT